jgi:UDP-N-acetylmuramate dehydrogenase
MTSLPVSSTTQEMTTLKAQLGLAAAPYSTYRIGGTMDEAYLPASIAEVEQWLEANAAYITEKGAPTVLGWGSNSLVATQGIRGQTLITRKLNFIEALDEQTFRIGAGVHLAKVAKLALDSGLSGGEFFVGIPGTMGGAVKMNAGAMGQETSTLIKQVLVLNFKTQVLQWLQPDALHFTYRYSAINPAHQLIVAADCHFEQGNIEEARLRMEQNMQFRKAHHPIEPNGGSVFRNPENAPSVGKIMDDLGARGHWRVGQAQVSPKHGNFIINLGEATSTEVLRLMLQMKEAAATNYNVEIYPENRFLGDATPEEQALWQALKGSDTHDA